MTRETEPVESELQAYVDGELSVDERARLEARLGEEPELRRKLQALRNVRDLVDDALAVDDDETGSSTTPIPGSARSPRRLWAAALIPAAAAVVVAVALVSRPDDEPVPSRWQENDVLAARCVPLRGGSWPLFSEMAVRLDLRSLDGRPIRLLSFPVDRDEVAVFADAEDRELSVAIEARVLKPGTGQWRIARLVLPEAAEVGTEGSLELPLRRLQVRDRGVVPYFGLRPGKQDAWREDFQWTFDALGAPSLAEWRPFVPEEPGEYRIELRLISLWFSGALKTDTVVRVTGVVSDWSEEQGGLRFRLAAASPELRPGSPAPLALQIENVGREARTYNFMGVTQARIPQPFHMTLLVDGEEWEQRDDYRFTVYPEMSFVPHPPGSIRTVLVSPSFWRKDGRDLDAMPGGKRLQVRFHFEPTVATGPVWVGEALTPPLRIDVREK